MCRPSTEIPVEPAATPLPAPAVDNVLRLEGDSPLRVDAADRPHTAVSA